MEYQIAGPWEEAVQIRRKVPTNSFGGWKHEYFAGYDEMGGAIWEKDFSFDHTMTLEEARSVLVDLKLADD